MAGCLYKRAFKLALTEDTLLLVGNNLIKFLEYHNHHEEIRRTRSDLKGKACVCMELTSKIDESYKFVSEDNLTKAKALVAESELFLEAHRGKLATILGDRVALLAFGGNKIKFSGKGEISGC